MCMCVCAHVGEWGGHMCGCLVCVNVCMLASVCECEWGCLCVSKVQLQLLCGECALGLRGLGRT